MNEPHNADAPKYSRCACGDGMADLSYVCDKCYNAGQYVPKQHLGKYGRVEVLSSPDASLPRGACFTATEFGLRDSRGWSTKSRSDSLLHCGYLPEGTVVRFEGQVYRVTGSEAPQCLEAV